MIDNERKREFIMLKKQDLIKIIAEQQGITKKEAKTVVDAFTSGVKSVLLNHESVRIPGFAKFTSEHKEARKQVFGVTGETIEVPAHYVYKAKMSSSIDK